MSYYKITFESDTIEGLKKLQGISPGNKSGSADSASSETPAPPQSRNQENTDAFVGAVQAPPPTHDQQNADAGAVQAPPPAGEAGAGFDASDEDSFSPPPPPMEDSAKTDNGPEAEVPKPPKHNR